MKPEFTIEQIRDFVKKDYQSVSARYVKALLQHYDSELSQANISGSFYCHNDKNVHVLGRCSKQCEKCQKQF